MTYSYLHGVFVAMTLAGTAGAQCGVEPLLQRIGRGTAGTNRIPLLDSTVPLVGAPYAVTLTSGRANAAAAIVIGVRVRPIFLPIWGATLYPDPPVFHALQLDAQGTVRLSLPGNVPVSFCGAEFVVQAGVFDPRAQGGLALTRALRMRFGGGGSSRALVSLRTSNSTCPPRTNLNIIDVSSLRVVRSFSINRSHLDVAVTSDGKLGVVASFCPPARVVVLNMTVDPPRELGSVQLSFGPQEIDIARDRYAIVTGNSRTTVLSSVDIVTRRIVNSLTIPSDGGTVEVAPDGSFALIGAISSVRSQLIWRINIAANGTISRPRVQLPIPYQVMNTSINPRGDQLLVATYPPRVLVVDIADGSGAMTLRQTITLPSLAQTIVHHPDGDTAYALLPYRKTVQILSRASNGNWSVTGQVAFASTGSGGFLGVDNMALMAGGSRLSVHVSGKVIVIDTVTKRIVGTIALSGGDRIPAGIATIGL